ncbi:MAG TPA: DUF5916 domain-containing protein [Candidatus Angelobacter sp.]
MGKHSIQDSWIRAIAIMIPDADEMESPGATHYRGCRAPGHRDSSSMKYFLAMLFLVAGIRLEGQSDRVITPARLAGPPHLSGDIDATWNTATVISDFKQHEPFEGTPATEKTVVKVAYDRHNLYFAIYCYDHNPEKIVARELRRDADYTVDDYVSIMISPRNDHRNGYVFTVNALGTQFDSLVADEGLVNDSNWDGIWTSEAKITPDGWTATVAIPFSTLNFKTSRSTTLGINFGRYIRRKNEEDLWQAYRRIYGLLRISQAGELAGLKDIGSGRLLVIKPYGLIGYRSNQLTGKDALHTAGVDLKYGITSTLLANATVNTDFADADVDPLRLNLTPFRVFLPENRPFFLENTGIFQFGDNSTQLFFSRQIGIDPNSGEQVPLDGGVKLTGSLAGFELGALDAHTRESGVNPAANYAVGRIKWRFLSESYIGAIEIDKESSSPGDDFNRTEGMDLHLVLWKKWTTDAYYAKTSSPLPQLQGRNWSGNLMLNYTSNLIQAEAQRKTVQPNFNPEVGFIDRTDLVTNLIDVNLSPRPKTGPIREYNFEGAFNYQTDTHGVLQTQEWQTTFRALFHNGAYTEDDFFDNFIQRLTTPFNIFKNVFIPAGIYHFDRHQFSWGSNQSKRFVYTVSERFGTYYNGTLNEFHAGQTYHPTSRISFNGSGTWDRFRLANQPYDVYVAAGAFGYSFNRFLATSAIVQVNTVENHPVSVNLRLRYTYRPDSDLFVIYNVGSQFNSIAAGNPVLTQERRLTVKFTYSFLR